MMTPSAPVVVAACAFLAPMPACAQTQSERTVRIVVASAPGSPADEQIRALLAFMSGSLGRALIVDNRGTGRGVPASETVARADPSGNTLLLGSSVTHAANPVLNERPSYDPTRDFVPITQIARTGMIVAGHRSLPEIATLAEQGIEGYDLPCWDGLFAPAGTPAEVVSAIHRSAAHALGTQSVRGLYLELGITPVGNTPAEFAAILTQDIAAFRRIAARSVAAAK